MNKNYVQSAILIVLCCFLFTAKNTSAQVWEWEKAIGGNGTAQANSIITNYSGYVYVVGFYSDTSITFGTTTLTNAGNEDVFIVKYNSSGNVVWAKGVGGVGNENAKYVTTDHFGNVYVAGYFTSPSLTFGTSTIINTGPCNAFLVKYNSFGTVLWAKSSEGNGEVQIVSISTDSFGNIYETGNFLLDSTAFDTDTLTNPGTFLVKYDSSGNVSWAERIGTGNAKSSSITNDAYGNVYVSGSFNDSFVIFGTTTLINDSSSTSDMFVVKYNSSGNLIWAKRAGGKGNDAISSISVDGSGYIYVAGFFADPTIVIGTDTLTNSGFIWNADILLIKYDSSGTSLWAKSTGEQYNDVPTGIFIDDSSNVYLTGWFDSPDLNFGTSLLINSSLYEDVFVLKYDSSGSALWAKGAGGQYNDVANSIASDRLGNIYITGYFNSQTMEFGTDTIINSVSYCDVFIAKINSSTLLNSPLISTTPQLISLFPNPAIDQLTVRSANQPINEITIYNLFGQIIYRSSYIELTQVQVNVADLPTGVYLIKVNGSEMRKFVKQ